MCKLVSYISIRKRATKIIENKGIGLAVKQYSISNPTKSFGIGMKLKPLPYNLILEIHWPKYSVHQHF